MELETLVALSNRYGKNPAYVLAGGGNTSVKDGDYMYVKASGTRLSTITEEGFVLVRRSALLSTMQKAYPDSDQEREASFLADVQASRLIPGETRRPSVESLLHALFPQRYVLHIHPAKLNGLTCSVFGERAARTLFGESVIWIPLCRPGYILGNLCSRAMADFKSKNGRDADVILLQNHGIFVAADTVEALDTLFDRVYGSIAAKSTYIPDFSEAIPSDSALAAAVAKAAGVPFALHCGHKAAVALSRSAEAAAPLLRPFSPDHIVVCGPFPIYAESVDGIPPAGKNRVVVLKDRGYFALGSNLESAALVASMVDDSICIAAASQAFGGPRHMTADMIDFIRNWEAESYRKKQF